MFSTVLIFRFSTDLILLLMGSILMAVAMRMWRTHPVNRVFSFGPYVTEEGMRFLLQHWLVVFTLGLTLTSHGLSRAAFKLWQEGYIDTGLEIALSVVETCFTTWAAFCLIRAFISLYKENRK